MARGNFGERLKRERELREVTLEEITSATRIGPRFLEALENEDWEKLPGGVFNRGFVRSVARYLGLDEESFLAEYDLAHGPIVQPVPQHSANHFSSRPKWIPFVAFLAFLLLLAGFITAGYFAWQYYLAHRVRKPSSSVPVILAPAKDANAPATAPAAKPADAANPTTTTVQDSQIELDLYVSLSEPTRMRILADGKVVVDGELPAGTNRHYPANQQFDVTVANSSAVLLELNGQALPPLGTPGASGTMTLTHKDLRPAQYGNTQP